MNDDKGLPPRGVGAVTPFDGGQICYCEYFPLGSEGCMVRHVDLSEPPASDRWTMHAWTRRGVYEPQNGSVGITRGHRISHAGAARNLNTYRD